jgi:chitodextrinase
MLASLVRQLSKLFRGRRTPRRSALRPTLEALEARLTPTNVSVLTNHYDNFLSGSNTQETDLTPANVNATNFGKLFSQPVDGYVYAQPLYVANLAIPGQGTHNVVFVATEHDSVYAFDADQSTGPGGGLLWKDSFLNPAAGVTSVPQADVLTRDIVPEVGITGTPVIDAGSGTLYVVAKTKEVDAAGTAHYVQRLHALDIATGAEKFGGPVTIGDTTVGGPDDGYTDTTNVVVSGSGDGGDGLGHVRFNALRELQRPALTLAGGEVYLAFASHGDVGPYHGWVLGYGAATLHLDKVFNTTPNDGLGGIWQSGGGLGVDGQGNLYLATGNAVFNASTGGTEYGDSVLKLSTSGALTVADSFTPFDQATLNANDADLGSGGTMLLPDSVGSAAHPHLLVETGKEGKIYLIDRDHMGGYTPAGPDNVVQVLQLGPAGVWGNPGYFQLNDTTGLIYYQGSGDVLKAFTIQNGVLSGPTTQSTTTIQFPGAQPILSSNGRANAIAWAVQVDHYASSGPATLYAYDAVNLSHLLYSSGQTGVRDQLDGAVKFVAPTVTNGHVYVGTQSSLAVFGLFPVATAAPAAVTGLSAAPLSTTQIRLTWTDPPDNPGANPTGFKVLRSTDGVHFTPVNTTPRGATTFTDTGLTAATTYSYEVVATNQSGDAAPSNVATAATHLIPPAVTVQDIRPAAVVLSWTPTANDHYQVERSTDNTHFSVIAPGIPAGVTTLTDTGLALGTYFYRVTGFNASPPDSAASAVVRATLGPGNIDQSGGFTDLGLFTPNGSAQLTNENLLRLTNNFGQAGSAFTTQKVGVRGFTATFTVRLHEGTQPNPADGFTFTLQGSGPTALGTLGGGLGYQGILNSVAVKFDTAQNPGDPSSNSTGLFTGGQDPVGGIDLTGTGINLGDQHTKQITLSSNGTVLHEVITDTTTGKSVTRDYTVNIPALVGGDTAFVGFTGGTGDLFSLQDILTFSYTEQEAGLPPRAPSGLHATAAADSSVTLTWLSNNAYTATSYQVFRSADGITFTPIGTAPAGSPTYTDSPPTAGLYAYQVRAVNSAGSSAGSNTAVVITPPPPVFSAHINFEPAGVPVPAGYLADTGAVYGDRGGGLVYGWNADNSGNTRVRNDPSSPDARYDTLAHMQDPSNPAAVWEIAVPNGTYTVHLVAGDPDYSDSIYRINVNGALIIDGTPNALTHWFAGTVTVPVTDGRLTVQSAAGAVNNKIDFIDITSSVPAPPPVPVGVAVTAGDGQASLSWAASPGAAGYNLYRAAVSGSEGLTPYRTGLTAPAFTDTGLTDGATYFYQVTAVGPAGESGKSAEVSVTPQSAASFSAHIKFQPPGMPVPGGYQPDTGAAYGNRGNGFNYGWNTNNSGATRARNDPDSPDPRFDSLAHMQDPSNPAAVWEMAVPNGTYTVHLVAGDPSYTDSVYKIMVNGVLAIDGTPTALTHWFEARVPVTVTDGLLTLRSAAGAVNNKIDFLDITPAGVALASAVGVAAPSALDTPNKLFVAQAYQGVLSRPAAAAELGYWANQLDLGLTPLNLATSLTHSDEYYAGLIRPLYRNYLGREADAGGLSYWVGRMHGGLTDEQLAAAFVGAPEFYRHAGGTDRAWVEAMYQNLLGRPADTAGEDFWTRALAAGADRSAVAYGFAASLERESQVIQADYQTFLGRSAGADEVGFWVNAFHGGLANEDVVSGFVGSAEFYRKSTAD